VLILLPVLIVLCVALLASGGVALKSRQRVAASREILPTAQRWHELDLAAAPPAEAAAPDLYEEALGPVFALTQNTQGTDLSLNDLMYYKLNLYYSANNSMSLNDLLARFRADNP
jgi:hypothetical protein